MCRKITFITAFICLLALSDYALAAQFNWTGGGTQHSWFDPANWNDASATSVPTVGDRACIEAKAPMPWLTTDACCQSLEINPWMWQYGPPDCNFLINSGHFDCNVVRLGGSSLQYALPGWTDTPGVLYMNGGLLTINDEVPIYANEDSPPAPSGGRGIWIGGGSTSFWTNYSNVVVNGGEIRTPKIAIYNGDLTINGGEIYDTCDSPSQLIIREEWERNKIYINGGTLGLDGDRVTELNNYITAQRIIPYNTRGEFVGPTYNIADTNTTLAAEPNLGSSWQPSPGNYDVDVHYHPTVGLTLTWKAGDWIGAGMANAHYVYMGTVLNDVDTVGIGTTGTASPLFIDVVDQPIDDVNFDPCTFVPEANVPFKPNYTYYWRVDEVNSVSGISYKGLVWQFKMHTDAASDPQPVSDGGLKMPLELSWMAGDWSAGIHRVYIATDYGACNAAGTNTTDGRYRGTVSNAVYPLSKLLDTGTGMAAFGQLDPETTYYWRIDEVSYTGGIKKGTPWNFDTGTYVTIDDFQEYDFTEDLNSVWIEGPVIDCLGSPLAGSGKISLVREGQSGRYMQFTYNKSGANGGYFSEIELPYSSSGVNWTSGGVISSPPKLLELAYRGFATNSSDGHSGYIYDRIYLAVEDKDDTVSIVLNPDPNAQQTGPWTTWATAYNQIEANTPGYPGTSVDMNYVTDLYLGAGVRCLDDYAYGGDGNIMFDNIRVLSATCVPAKGPVADFDGNCVVNLFDLDVLASDWLVQEWDYNWITSMVKPAEPNLWYKFDETAGVTVADSGTRVPGDANGPYNGEVQNLSSTLTWSSSGHNGRCIYLPAGQQSYVEATTNGNPVWWVAGTTGISFSIWENADMTADTIKSNWAGIFGTWNAGVTTETLEIHCPSPWDPAVNQYGPSCNFINRNVNGPTAGTGVLTQGDFGGRWNNWIFVHDRNPADVSITAEMRTYLNGVLVADANNIDGAGCTLPLMSSVGSVRIGTRGSNWGMWAGKLDDFKVWNYALSVNEVHYIATDGTGLIHVPLVSPANIKSSSPEIVNFGDMAMMVDEWLTTKLWP